MSDPNVGLEPVAPTVTPAVSPLEFFARLNDDAKRRVLDNAELSARLWDSLSTDPRFQKLDFTAKTRVAVHFGFPLNKVPIPPITEMRPPSVIPGAVIPEPQPIEGPAIGTTGTLAIPRSAPMQQNLARTQETAARMAGVFTDPTMTQLPKGMSMAGILKEKARGAVAPYFLMHNTPEDTFYNKILRGGSAAVLSAPADYQPDALSWDNTAKVATMILATAGTWNPAGIAGKAAAVAVGGPMWAIGGFMLKHPGLARAVTSAAYDYGRFASIQVAREWFTRSVQEGRASKAELQQVLGDELFNSLVIGMPASYALRASTNLLREVKDLGGTITRSVGEALSSPDVAHAVKAMDDVLWPTSTLIRSDGRIVAQAPNQQLQIMTGSLRDAHPGDWVTFKNGKTAQVLAKNNTHAQVEQQMGNQKLKYMIPLDADRVAQVEGTRGTQPTSSYVETGKLRAEGPWAESGPPVAKPVTVDVYHPKRGTQRPSEAEPMLYFANDPGRATKEKVTFYNLLDVADSSAAKARLGLSPDAAWEEMIPKALDKGYDGIAYTTKEGKEYIHMPYAARKGTELYDTGGNMYVLDSFTPTQDGLRAVVVDPKGQRLIKDPSTLRTETEMWTLGKTIEASRSGQRTPVPEGRMTYQNYEVVNIQPDGTATFRAGGGGGNNHNSIPHRAVSEPAPTPEDRIGPLAYWAEPSAVLARYNDPQLDQVVKHQFDAMGQYRTLQRDGDRFARGLQEQVGRDKAAAERLTRHLIGLPREGGEDALQQGEREVVHAIRLYGMEEVIPILNAERAARQLPPIPKDWPVPLLLYPEILLSSGNKYLIGSAGGHTVKSLAESIQPVLGTTQQEVVIGSGLTSTLDVKANVWEWLKAATQFVAEKKALGGLSDRIAPVEQYAKETYGTNLALYLNWLGRAVEGRTVTPIVAEVFDHAQWINSLQRKLRQLPYGTKSSAKLGNIDLVADRWPLNEVNLFDVVARSKTVSYAATIALSLRTMYLNYSQPWTHILPQLPAQRPEDIGRNVGAILYGMGKGSRLGVGEMSKNFLEYFGADLSFAGKFLGSAEIRKYQDAGIIGDLEEVFNPHVTAGARVPTKLWEGFKGVLFANMRLSEITNRIAGSEAGKKVMEDIFRVEQRGMRVTPLTAYGAAMDIGKAPRGLLDIRRWDADKELAPDIRQAIDDYATILTNYGNFVYGQGFKSVLHERFHHLTRDKTYIQRGMPQAIATLGEALMQFNTFAYKTISASNVEWQQFTRNHPNFVRRLASIEAPDEFIRVMKTLDENSRNQFWRTVATRMVVGSAMAQMTGASSFMWQALGYDMGISHVVSATVRTLMAGPHPFDILREGIYQFAPGGTAIRRYQKGEGFGEQFLFTTRDRRDQDKPMVEQFMDRLLGGAPSRR